MEGERGWKGNERDANRERVREREQKREGNTKHRSSKTYQNAGRRVSMERWGE